MCYSVAAPLKTALPFVAFGFAHLMSYITNSGGGCAKASRVQRNETTTPPEALSRSPCICSNQAGSAIASLHDESSNSSLKGRNKLILDGNGKLNRNQSHLSQQASCFKN